MSVEQTHQKVRFLAGKFIEVYGLIHGKFIEPRPNDGFSHFDYQNKQANNPNGYQNKQAIFDSQRPLWWPKTRPGFEKNRGQVRHGRDFHNLFWPMFSGSGFCGGLGFGGTPKSSIFLIGVFLISHPFKRVKRVPKLLVLLCFSFRWTGDSPRFFIQVIRPCFCKDVENHCFDAKNWWKIPSAWRIGGDPKCLF